MISTCKTCVFHECGDAGYGARCNMENNDIHDSRPCSRDNNKSFNCIDYRSKEQMRILLDKDSGKS